ncbi:MAG: M48 family metallopeptidase [Hyphomicrobiaceae bacterium]
MRSSAQQVGADHQDLTVAGLAAPVEIRRHPAARRLTVRVSPTRRAVIVTMPMRCGLSEANRFLAAHLDWVREHLDKLPAVTPFTDGTVIPFRGALHTLRFVGPQRLMKVVEVVATEAGGELHVTGKAEHAARRLKDWLIAEARADLDARVQWHARNLRLRPRRIAVRDQATRWGSCSSNGVLSFSWRLVLAPSLVLDYVAAHEVAHLAEMNHGPRFWELVRMTMPRMEEARLWLRGNGAELHAYDVVS